MLKTKSMKVSVFTFCKKLFRKVFLAVKQAQIVLILVEEFYVSASK